MKKHRSLRRKQLGLVVSAISALLAGTADTALAQDDELEEITVTGSRIVRRDLSAPSPIVTVGTENFENSSTISAESVLNQLPQFVPSGTQFATGFQGSATTTPGAATLNLRGLGSNRNLVLIDGRRGQPSNATLVIDINTIPQAAIQNVEVITGGASAVYGPDAMAGVVNFVLKDDFEGAEFDLRTGETMEGDGAETSFSGLFGVNSGDGKGNVMIGLDWTKREPVYQVDRDFFVNGWLDPGNPLGQFMQATSYSANEFLPITPGGPPVANWPSQAVVNSLFPMAPAGAVSRTSEFRFNEDNSLFVSTQGYGYKGPLNCLDFEQCGSFTGVKRLTNGNLDQFGTVGLASTPMKRHSFFGKAQYDLTDDVSAFAQTSYSNIEVITRGGIPPAITVWQAPIDRNANKPVPAGLAALLDSRDAPNAPWSLYQVLDYNGPIEPLNQTNMWQMMAGLEGDLMEGDWSWEAYVSRGDTNVVIENHRLPSLQRYQWLVNQSGYGQGTFTGLGRGYIVTCTTGLPVFSEFTPSENCMDIIDSRMINQTNLTQEIAEANLQGGAFDLPAGQVRFAAGLSYRNNTFDYQPGNPVTEVLDNPVGLFASNGTSGSTNVREVYGELLVPVLEGLDAELGYRYSDFNTAGGVDTYKALFTWQALESVTVRGGYQFATRAPNTAELFTGPTQQVVGFTNGDPCSVTTLWPWGNVAANPNRTQVQNLCRAIIGNNTSGFDTQTYSITGVPGAGGFHRQNPPFFPLEIEVQQGNPNVAPEEGETWTLGAVISEPFGIERLTATIDLYDIEINDAISPEPAVPVYARCLSAGGENPTFSRTHPDCLKIRRNPSTGDREEVDAFFSNLGLLKTSGIDIQLNYGLDLGPGTLQLATTVNYLDSFEYQLTPTSALLDAKGTLDQGGQFDYRVFSSASYNWDNWTLGVNWRHLPEIDSAAVVLAPNTTQQGADSYDIFNMNGAYSWDRYTVRFGIDNILDTDPEAFNYIPGGDTNTDTTNAGYYDILGRRWYMGVKVTF